jgi:hypothetical protein
MPMALTWKIGSLEPRYGDRMETASAVVVVFFGGVGENVHRG